jgi:hypothetical protein
MRAFKVKDLMINVVPQKASGGGGTSLPGPDSDITDFPPTITPVIMVAKETYRLRVLDKIKIEQLDVAVLENLAVQVGRAAVAGMFLCTEEMATCQANERISPFASMAESLRFDDLITVRGLLDETMSQISMLEKSRLEEARGQAAELIPMLEGALSELKGRG